MGYIDRLLWALAAFLVSSAAYACGPYFWTKENIKFFKVTDESATPDPTKEENLRLWQRETSAGIPLADIEEIVYGPFAADEWRESEVPDSIGRNKFYRWIRKNKATDIEEFLSLAKRVERLRREKCSPWYYPVRKQQAGADDSFTSLIECCSAHKDGRLKARYGLQLTRLLHGSGQYEQCVAEFNKWFDDIPDTHLMKRMAMDYVAGSWAWLGDADKANNYFAMKGDASKLCGVKDILQFMASVNPAGCPMKEFETRLGGYYPGECYSDEEVKSILPIASRVVSEGKAQNIGEWEFLMAYLEGEYNHDYEAADKLIRQALAHGLPTQTGRDHARAYKMAVDGARGNRQSLLADLKWIESKVINGGDASLHWRDYMIGIVYGYWFRYLIDHQEQSLAIMMANYVDQFCGYIDMDELVLPSAQDKEQMRKSRKERNIVDYNGRFFEFIMTLRAQDIIDYKHSLNGKSKLVAHLRDGGRNDDDYLDEIIGTLYLQECNYGEAIKWLSKVSPEYQYTLNTYKEGYLARDPFAFTPESRLDKGESKKPIPNLKNTENIKLNFAKEMYRLERQMRFAYNWNDRAVAKVKYTLARYASFSSCWALTAYLKGYRTYDVKHYFDPGIAIFGLWEERADLEESRMKCVIENVLDNMDYYYVEETKAEIHYLLGNLKTIAKKYPDTSTGQFLSKHCDHWKDWI